MRNFNPLEDIDTYMMTEKVCIVRTGKLIETLMFMQNAGWKLYEIQPDDEGKMEFNILTYYKPKGQKQN